MKSSQPITPKEEEDCLRAIQYATSTVLPFALKTAVDLRLFEIIAESGPGSKVSAAEIVSKLPTTNPKAPDIVDRILRFLTTHSVLDCDLVTDQDGNTRRSYGVSSIGRYFLPNENGISVVPMLNLTMDRRLIECWNFLKEATLEGGLSFQRAFGEDMFEAVSKDRKLANTFNQAMSNHTAIVMEKVLQIYRGFQGLTQVIDVGGGLGTNLKLIVSKYPQIKGINFDLPLVVKDAPNIPGVEHVGGDMFNKIPNGEVIFMKWVLHDWGDDECLKLLRNCCKAVSERGKVILIESMMSELPSTDVVATTTIQFDVGLLHLLPGAKERTLK
ncbi:caffeate O-methyltransferase 1, O-methyltransferase 1, O-methyltransferase 3 [Hibiscus trionum]|uniref:Caffeate O-methyltransferase 1, O-methyltransferase 1, O-methyltransferase 3 n=1 Tax=Hibiscus trionum TaxID=183268 RepID=A0A9W7M103_HIBTR|nr:caffeate O-methyltransferase 1, O-methyltransferase 1, O-methyltransferase 3 [Hibiscus trionum]